jgi:hypothetical protein
MEPVENLDHDWSQIVDEQGRQLATVGHHLQLSRGLNRREQQRIRREGTCLACHQEIPNESLAVSILHHVAEVTGQLPETTKEHNDLVNKIVLTSAWVQVLVALGVPLGLVVAVAWHRRRRRRRAG